MKLAWSVMPFYKVQGLIFDLPCRAFTLSSLAELNVVMVCSYLIFVIFFTRANMRYGLHHICCNFHSSPSPSYRWQNIKRTFWQWPCGLTVYSGPQIVKLWKNGSEKVQQSVDISGFHRFNTIYALCRLENAANHAFFGIFWSPKLWSHDFFGQSSCLFLSVAALSSPHAKRVGPKGLRAESARAVIVQ